MTVIIKCNTGFVGAIHEEETGLSVEEWNALSDQAKEEYYQGVIEDNIETYAVDEDDEETRLN